MSSLAFSPDGTYLLTASQDKTVRLWNNEAGEELRRFKHPNEILAVAFNFATQLLATSTVGEREARIWDINTGQEKRRLVHDKEIDDISFNMDGSRVLTASRDGTARLWNPLTGQVLSRLSHEYPHNKMARELGYGSVLKARMSLDGARIVTIPGGKNAAVIWDTKSASELFRITHKDWIHDVVFSPDGSRMATGSADGTIGIWKVKTGKLIRYLDYGSTVNKVVFSSDGKHLAAAARMSEYGYGWGEIVAWNPSTGERTQRFGGHPSWYRDIVFNAHSQLLAAGSSDQTATVWDAKSGHEQARLKHMGTVLSLKFTPDTSRLTTYSTWDRKSTLQKSAQVWDWKNGLMIGTLTTPGGTQSMWVTNDQKRVLTWGIDKTLRVWDAESGHELHRIQGLSKYILSEDHKYLATPEEDDDVIQVRRLSDDTIIARLDYEGELRTLALGPDAKFLAAVLANKDEEIWIWDVVSATVFDRISPPIESPQRLLAVEKNNVPKKIHSLSFSPNGTLLAVAGRSEEKVMVWDMATQKLIGRLSSQKAPGIPGRFQFSPDSRQLVTYNLADQVVFLWDRQSFLEPVHQIRKRVGQSRLSPNNRLLAFPLGSTVEVWEVETETLRFVFAHDKDGPVWDLSFSSDGKRLATASSDLTARIWDLTSGLELVRLPHLHTVGKVAFASSNRILVTQEWGGSARGWDTNSGEELFRFSHVGTLDKAIYNSGGSRVVTNVGSKAQIWNAQTAKKVAEFSNPNEIYTSVLSADGHLLATVLAERGPDKIVYIQDVATGQQLYQLAHEDSIRSVIFSADDQLIITGADDHAAIIWEASTGKRQARFVHNEPVQQVMLSADKTYLAVRTKIGMDSAEDIHIWHLPTKRKVARLPHDGKSVNKMSFRPGHSELATAAGDSVVRLWNLESARVEAMHLNHEETVFNVEISPILKRLAAEFISDKINYVPVWDLTTGVELFRLNHKDTVHDMTLSRDGKRLATASSDRTARVWNFADGHEILRLPP